MRITLLFLFVLGSCSCGRSSGTRSPSRAQLDSELVAILGVPVPTGATDVGGDVTTVMTHVVDVEFTCTRPDFEAFWASVPRLSSEVRASDVDLDPFSSEPDFRGQWSAGGGSQFCSIVASTVPTGDVRVIIRGIHEMN